VSHRVSGRAACPWRLYYTRYYTGAAISTSQATAGTPDLARRALLPLEGSDTRRPCGRALSLAGAIANAHAFSRPAD
jgi:hypothetical protein